MGVGGQRHAPAALPRERDLVPIVWEAGWAPGQVWTCAENLVTTGIRSQDRPTRSESLYRLHYPGPLLLHLLLSYRVTCYCIANGNILFPCKFAQPDTLYTESMKCNGYQILSNIHTL